MPDFKHIALRPSLAPVVKQCPSAMYVDPNMPVMRTSTNDVFSKTGTALHDVFKEVIYPGHAITVEALLPIAARYEVAMEGYFGIIWRAKKIAEKWSKLAGFYQGATLERKLSATLSNGYVLEGTPDLFSVHGEFAVVNDLKTGEKEFDYFAQVELYALMIWKQNQALGLKKVYGALFHPMLDKFTNEEISEDRLRHVEDYYTKMMLFAGMNYVTGPACAICPRLLTCPAIKKSVDPMITDMRSGREVTALDIKAWRPMVKYLEKCVENYKVIEHALLERMGSIDLGDGYELYLKTDFQEKLKPLEAFHVLTGDFKIPPEKVIEQMKISKAAVDEAARAIAIPRDRAHGLGATKMKLHKALEEKGATYKKPRVSATTRPIAITK